MRLARTTALYAGITPPMGGVFVRPNRPGDAAESRRALLAADYETLHERFLGSPPHDQASIRRLVEVDYVNRLAQVALAPDGSGVRVAPLRGRDG